MPTAYIETTVPSYYVARPAISVIQAARQASTREWWDEGCSGFELFTSQETLDEAARGEPAMAERRLALLDEIGVLPASDSTDALTKILLAKDLIPAKAASDAVQIAVASVHEMDFLVTWNFRHIGNPHIRERLRSEISDFGAELPVICTPEELLNDETE
jgi:hypothetical protein